MVKTIVGQVGLTNAQKAAFAQMLLDGADATDDANDAATLANTKAGLANDAATLATTKAGLADTAATNANDKATLANEAATNANSKAALCDTAIEECEGVVVAAGSLTVVNGMLCVTYEEA